MDELNEIKNDAEVSDPVEGISAQIADDQDVRSGEEPENTDSPIPADEEAAEEVEKETDPLTEISVLDYLKFRLNPKNIGKEILPTESPSAVDEDNEDEEASVRKQGFAENFISRHALVRTKPNLLFFVLSICFALTAQIVLEPAIIARTNMSALIGGGLYALCAFCFLAAFLVRQRDENETGGSETAPDTDVEKRFSEKIRYEYLGLCGVCTVLAFFLFGGNQFTFLNVSVWSLSVIFALLAFSPYSIRELISQGKDWFVNSAKQRFSIRLHISAWNLIWIAVFLVCAFFLFHNLDAVPVDMVSDHAEKLYDIRDILNGDSPIFFTRNTGRECFQFYFTVLIIKIFGTGLSFLSLKIGTALAGLFILPFVYKLGKMLGNRRIGLIAMFFCGISYWPVVIQRAALRFAYYPMFTAPALYFFIKGLRDRSRGALIWSGIFLGVGLHGYSPFRVVPLAFAVFFIIYLLMDVKSGSRTNAVGAFLCLVLFAFLVFLPLARVTLDMPEMVVYRSLSRIGETEKSFDSSPAGIFADNFWKGLVMPFWSDGSTWVHSITYRPALEHFTASFFFLGLLFVLIRIIQERRWDDICVLLSIPLLMLPSTLSLAFPGENPCLNRTAGALIPVLLVAAAGFCCVFDVLAQMVKRHGGAFVVTAAAAIALLCSIFLNNYDLVFRRFAYEYNRSAWNTKQIGGVIKGFADSIGSYSEAYVIPYPHWVDTRLVGINAGDPEKDYSFDKSFVSSLPEDGKPRLFIYRESDTEAADAVRTKYPFGVEQLHVGPYSGKNFYSYTTFSSGSTGAY